MTSYRAECTEIREVPSYGGKGLFAKVSLPQDGIVCVKGGHIMTTAEYVGLPVSVRQHAMQIEAHLFLGPRSESEIPANSMYLNHSCEPNVGIRGQIVFVALRDIEPGEQLLVDYALMYTDASAFVAFDCKCASSKCRGRVTADDWKQPGVRALYRGHFADFIERRLR